MKSLIKLIIPAFNEENSIANVINDVPKIVDWYMDGKINIDDLITHKMPLDDINQAFDLMHAGTSIRSVVVY